MTSVQEKKRVLLVVELVGATANQRAAFESEMTSVGWSKGAAAGAFVRETGIDDKIETEVGIALARSGASGCNCDFLIALNESAQKFVLPIPSTPES